MRTFARLTILAPLVLTFPLSAFAQTAASPDLAVAAPAATTTKTPTTTTATTTADRETYVQKTRDDVRAWRGKLDAFATDTRASASAAGSEGDRALHSAWAELQVASDQLENVGADGWAAAKSSYEKASDDFSSAWRKVRPSQL